MSGLIIQRWCKSAALWLALLALTACSKTVQWKEEAKLNDGRVIVVTQKKRCEGGDYTAKTNASCLAREAWLTFNLPEFSEKEILWNESLNARVVNIHEKKLYIVGSPPTTLELRGEIVKRLQAKVIGHTPSIPEINAYAASNPPYFGFLWDAKMWIRIPFADIPQAIYDTNMLIPSIPKIRTDFLDIRDKNSETENGNPVYPLDLRRIDPKYRTSAY